LYNGNAVQNQVRALFNELFQDGLERPEAFLDQLLQMTSMADIVYFLFQSMHTSMVFNDMLCVLHSLVAKRPTALQVLCCKTSDAVMQNLMLNGIVN